MDLALCIGAVMLEQKMLLPKLLSHNSVGSTRFSRMPLYAIVLIFVFNGNKGLSKTL